MTQVLITQSESDTSPVKLYKSPLSRLKTQLPNTEPSEA
jgi:hypothetical protein